MLFIVACEWCPDRLPVLDIGRYTIGLRPYLRERKPLLFRENLWASYPDGSCRELHISQFLWFTLAQEVSKTSTRKEIDQYKQRMIK
jgi:hypothetical protein